MKATKYIVGGLFLSGLALIINYLFAKAKTSSNAGDSFGNPLKKMTIRKDVQGSGRFWKSRIGHYHEGIDIECSLAEPVFSPISGTITKKSYPYPTDKRFEGCTIQNGISEIKLFYMVCGKVGQKVSKGEQIGVCQAINIKYGSSMKNHLHIEIRQNGNLLNPETIYKL